MRQAPSISSSGLSLLAVREGGLMAKGADGTTADFCIDVPSQARLRQCQRVSRLSGKTI
jgi:hypothetical protein